MKILRLKEILNAKGISGKELAQSIGTTEATISNLAKGEAIPRKDMLLKIATFLDVDIREIFVSTKDQSTAKEKIDKVRALLDQLETEHLTN